MDNSRRDPRSSFSRTPLKHNASADEQDRPTERGYTYNHGHRHRPPITNTASFNYSQLGDRSFSHYGRRDSYNRRPTGDISRTPSKNEHHQRERDKEREMMSIYGRGDDNPTLASSSSSQHNGNTANEKKYHNPCRFAGHDHEWRDCPNNYRNKKRSQGSFSGTLKYKNEVGEGSSMSGIGKSTSWGVGAGGGDYYGPASEASGTGQGHGERNSDRHTTADNRDRGYKDKSDVSLMGNRSKSFGAESSSRERVFDGDNESASGTVDSDHSPRNNPASVDRKWHQHNNRHERSNYYSPAAVSKPRASPPLASQHERGYSSSSFTPLSTEYNRRGSVPMNPNIPVPLFNRSQSYDTGSVRDAKRDEEGGDSSFFYRKLAADSSSPMTSHDTSPSAVEKHSGSMSPPRSQSIHRLNSNPAQDPGAAAAEGLSQHARSGSKVFETTDAPHPPTPSSPTKQPAVTKEEPAPLSLTCAELGAPEKVSKAEAIVSKMNALMNKAADAVMSDSGESAVRLPSKNEILKCMAVIDGKIKVKDDNASAVKKQIKEIEREKIAEENRLLKQEEEKRQSLIDGVATRKTEREGSIQTKEDDFIKAVDAQKASSLEGMSGELLKFESHCSDAIQSSAAKLNFEISTIQNEVEEAEMTIEDMDAPLASSQEDSADLDIDESDFVPTLDAPGKMASLISSILEDNQRIAAEAHHESLEAIPYFPQSEEEMAVTRNSPTSVITNEEWSNRARKVTGLHDALYTCPSDVPMFDENNESFLEMGSQIKECIRLKKKKLKKRWEDLASQYLVRQMIFNEETGVNTETSERGGFFSITGRVDESGEIRPLENVRGNNPYRRPRRGVSPGDVARSEYEQEQIIAEIAAKEAMEKRIKEGGCALPHQRGMLENTLFASFSNGFLGNRVDDFMEDEEERRSVNVWTDMEKCIFFDRFLQHPKDFRKISSFLRNKTTKDCIAFYYNSKKTIPYKHALKEFLQRKKRHGSVIAWDATIQAALSVGATVKAGESPEKPLKFILPQSDYTFRTHPFHPMQLEVFNNLETVALNAKHHEEVKSKPKRSNWFILDASSRKYIKHYKDDKDQSFKRKSTTLSDDVEDIEPKKIQRTSEMPDVHTGEEKKSAKANKWKADEKKVFFEAVEQFGHNWGKVSEHVGTRTATQCKNYFYDNKKQMSKKKEKASKLAEEGSKKNSTNDKKVTEPEKGCTDPDEVSANPSSQEGVVELHSTSNPAEASVDVDVGLCMPVSQSEMIASAEEQFRQQLLLEQRNHQYIQQQQELMQHQDMIQERLLQQHMQRIHDAQRMQEAQRIEDARQMHQEEMLRQQHQQQWLHYQQQHQQQHNQHRQSQDWVEQQQLHNIQQLLALRGQEQSPMNQNNNYAVHQGRGYQGNDSTQPSEIEIFQSRMQAVAALVRQGNENQSQQQQQLELLQRFQQQQLGQNNGYPHFHQGGR